MRRFERQEETVTKRSIYTTVCDFCGQECEQDAPAKMRWFELRLPSLDDFDGWGLDPPPTPADLCSVVCVSAYATKAQEFVNANT